jgi:predicted MPP superfamily phosphohydrolase
MRHGIFYLFFGVILTLDVLAHRYLYVRLFRDPDWPDAVRRGGLVVCVLLAILLPAGIALSRALPRAWAEPLAHAAFAWMGTAFYLLLVLFAVDLARWVTEAAVHLSSLFAGGAGAPPEPAVAEVPSPERRALLKQATAGVAGVAAAGLSGAALRSGLAEVEVREVAVKLDKLPPALSGLNLVQLSDVHVGPTLGERFLRSVVDKTNQLRPDAVLITGDLVDGSVAQLRAHVAPLAGLKSRFGVYFVTGNHEYYSGAEAWEAELQRLGIRVLRNERVTLGDQASLDLAGVDDANARGMARGHGADVARIVAGRDPERALVLMAHQPKQIDLATQAGADLQLSGHTHGGQLWPFSAMVKLAQPYVAGLYQHDPATQIYVSRGTGYWGPPMRLMAPAEITKIVLT